MRLSWNEVRTRAARFAENWHGAAHEKGETHSFYNEFVNRWHSLAPRAPSGQSRANSVGNPVGGVGNGLVRKVGIAFSCLDQGVTEQLGNRHHVHAVHR